MKTHRSRREYLARIGAGVASLSALAGCQNAENASGGSTTAGTTQPPETTTTTSGDDSRTVTDMIGREVRVPETVDSVLGLGSGGLRMIVYAGATDKVVAVEQQEAGTERDTRPYLLANPELTKKPSVGSRKDPNVEAIVQEDPDVIVWGYAGKKKADTLQQKTNVPVVVVTPGALTQPERPNFSDALSFTGRVLNQSDVVEDLAAYTSSTLADVEERRPESGEQSPRVFIGFLGRGKHGLLYTQPRYPAFSLTGAYNVASVVTEDLKTKKGAARTTVNAESFIEWDPTSLFVDLGGESYDALSKPEYESVAAIEREQIYGVLPTRDYATNFGTSLANVYYVGSVLFPDAFGDVDPAEKADEIYEEFVGAPVYDAVVDAYGGGFHQLSVN